MRCRIHRGCHEIGGNCVEVESQGKRIVLDIGLPLKDNQSVGVPDISGLMSPDDGLLGIFISHPHPDHYGLLAQIGDHVPIYIGAAARRIIEASSLFTPLPTLPDLQTTDLSDHQPLQVGPFTVTPFLMDHSAYDSYCFLIEAGGRRLFYSGDLRAHGRKASLFDRLVKHPPTSVDVLICEGTQVGRKPDFAFPDEQSVQDRMTDIFCETEGMCLVWCSGQNIDRIVTIFKATRRSQRQLIVDMYTAEILRATGNNTLPQADWDGVSVYLPISQKNAIKRQKAFDVPKPYYPHRIYPETLKGVSDRSVMTFRPSMLRELADADCLAKASLVTSIWSGYLARESERLNQLKALGVGHVHAHTSGHATVDELKRFVAAFGDSRIVPIHLEDRDAFAELSVNVELQHDGKWWEV